MAESFDHQPISEGMRYGPIPLPEDTLEAGPEQIIWEVEARRDPGLYVLWMLREQLYEDKDNGEIDPEVFERNRDRLNLKISELSSEKERFYGRVGHISKKTKRPPLP